MLNMLDTDIASYIIKGRTPHIEARLQEILPSKVCISVITRTELLYGLRRLPAEHQLHVAVEQFLKIINILPWPLQAADYYAEIRHQLVSSGKTIGEMDMMIAAHSLSAGAILVTNNLRHFKQIKAPLTLENWAFT